MRQSALLSAAIDAARAGEEVIRHYYGRGVGVELKPDQSPVTVADCETEQEIKRVLQGAFPHHGFFGEETGREQLDADYTWLVDPIDGTKSFIREIPFFSTQIALMKDESLILGVSNAPIFGELAYAETDCGAFLNDRRVHVSDVSRLADAALSFGNVRSLASGERSTALAELFRSVDRVRGYGDFYHYHLLAAGKLDIVVESDINILDVAALSVIVQEAGGLTTDIAGNPLSLDSTSILAGTVPLHECVRALLHRHGT